MGTGIYEDCLFRIRCAALTYASAQAVRAIVRQFAA